MSDHIIHGWPFPPDPESTGFFDVATWPSSYLADVGDESAEMSAYWEGADGDAINAAENLPPIKQEETSRGLKRYKCDSSPTLDGLPDAASQWGPRKLRVTKSLGPEASPEEQKLPAPVDPRLRVKHGLIGPGYITPFPIEASTPARVPSEYTSSAKLSGAATWVVCPSASGVSRSCQYPVIKTKQSSHPRTDRENAGLLLGRSDVPHFTINIPGKSSWGTTEPTIKEEDSYSIATSDEEDLARLLDSVSSKPAIIPSSSVVRSIDTPSSREGFDPNLPGSLPLEQPFNQTPPNLKPVDEEEDLLDSSVDWDEIISLLPERPHDPSLSVSPIPSPPRELPPRASTAHHPPQANQSPPQPFVRPPFPFPVRDKSPITGISSNSLLRTTFRIGQLLNESKRAFLAHQSITFELYARVTYSSREIRSRVQHFQFVDLFRDQLPYPTGTLKGWKTGCLIDEASKAFLGSGEGSDAKVCRCVCRPVKDTEGKKELGWVFEVLNIRVVEWEEVEGIRGLVCGV